MFVSAPHHRLFLLAFTFAFLVPFSAGAAVDIDDCLEDATDERTDALSDAYSTYNDLMDELLHNFGDTESNAYRVTDDGNYRSGEVYRAQSNYTRQMEEANRNLNTRVQNIWNNYNAKVALCNGNSYNYNNTSNYSSSSYRYQTPNSAYNFVYPQSYSYSYSYPYTYQYSYPYLYYPYSYSYPQYNYAIYPYSYNSSYVSRPQHYQTDPYAQPYYRGRGTCRTPNVGNPPAGCAYKFYLDEEGCYEYKLRC